MRRKIIVKLVRQRAGAPTIIVYDRLDRVSQTFPERELLPLFAQDETSHFRYATYRDNVLKLLDRAPAQDW